MEQADGLVGRGKTELPLQGFYAQLELAGDEAPLVLQRIQKLNCQDLMMLGLLGVSS